MWGRRFGDPAEDDDSPRADTLRAIRRVEKERVAGVGLPLILAMVGAYREGLTFSSGPEVLLAALLAAAVAIYIQICGARMDALRRELRGLPPRWTT